MWSNFHTRTQQIMFKWKSIMKSFYAFYLRGRRGKWGKSSELIVTFFLLFDYGKWKSIFPRRPVGTCLCISVTSITYVAVYFNRMPPHAHSRTHNSKPKQKRIFPLNTRRFSHPETLKANNNKNLFFSNFCFCFFFFFFHFFVYL